MSDTPGSRLPGPVSTGRVEGLAALLDARSVAIVGASDRTGSLGSLPLRYLQRYGYRGRIHPVNPRAERIGGLPSMASVRDIGAPVDLALVMVRADQVPAVLDDCLEAGVQVAVVMSSGFAETGVEGAALQDAVAARTRGTGLRVVGPNCIGAVNFHTGLMATFTPLFSAPDVPIQPGGLGFVSQSGALGYGAVSLALERGLPLGWAVNTGNESDVTALEVVAALAERDECEALLGYVEQVADVDSLRRIAATGKPVALIKAGDSDLGGRAAASHTGALSGSRELTDAAFAQFGIARARDVDELLDLGAVFAQGRVPAGRRVAVVTTSGGSGILAADAVAEHGLELAGFAPATQRLLDDVVPDFGSTANPVDVTATVMADPSLFGRCLDALMLDDGVDAVVACFAVLTGDDVADVVTALGRAVAAADKPLVVTRTGAGFLAPEASDQLRRLGIPTYVTPRQAVTALAGLRAATTPARPPRPVVARGRPPAACDEVALKALLGEHGCRVPRGGLAEDADGAVRLVEEVGGRAVMKAVVPGLVHKSEVGGVRVGVTPSEAAGVFEDLAALGGQVLVEELVSGGVEMLVGAQGTALGPSVTLATGGVFSELFGDAATRLAPVDHATAAEMLAGLQGAALLAGARGGRRREVAPLLDVVVRVSELVAGWPAGFELDLNPVVVTDEEAVVLDAALVLEGEHDG